MTYALRGACRPRTDSKRADSIGVIARAAAASALHGTGPARLGAELGVPAATVRGWLRRLRSRAAQMLQEATAGFSRLVAVIGTPEGRDPSPPGPAGAPLGDALALVIACARRDQVARPCGSGPGRADGSVIFKLVLRRPHVWNLATRPVSVIDHTAGTC
jgi:hypothetical protein